VLSQRCSISSLASFMCSPIWVVPVSHTHSLYPLCPFHFSPVWYSISGFRWVYPVSTDSSPSGQLFFFMSASLEGYACVEYTGLLQTIDSDPFTHAYHHKTRKNRWDIYVYTLCPSPNFLLLLPPQLHSFYPSILNWWLFERFVSRSKSKSRSQTMFYKPFHVHWGCAPCY
jgi:hypothetical protein